MQTICFELFTFLITVVPSQKSRRWISSRNAAAESWILQGSCSPHPPLPVTANILDCHKIPTQKTLLYFGISLVLGIACLPSSLSQDWGGWETGSILVAIYNLLHTSHLHEWSCRMPFSLSKGVEKSVCGRCSIGRGDNSSVIRQNTLCVSQHVSVW